MPSAPTACWCLKPACVGPNIIPLE
jgi:hypothetical protein